MIPRSTAFAAALVTFACAAKPDASATPTKAWLTSSWVTHEGTCATTKNVLRYSADGTYAYLDEVGRWELAGSTLKLTQTAEIDAAGVRKDGPRESVNVQAERLPDGRLRVMFPRGDVYTFYRCG